MSVKLDGLPGLLVAKVGGSSLASPRRFARVVELVASERERSPFALVVSAFGDTTDVLIGAFARASGGDFRVASEVSSEVSGIARVAATAVLSSRDDEGSALTRLDGVMKSVGDELRSCLLRVAETRDASGGARDEVLAFGELLSSRVVAFVLEARGVPAFAVDARTWLVTDDVHGDASALFEPTRERAAALAATWFDGAKRVGVHTGFLGKTVGGRTTTLGRNGSDYTAAVLAASLGAKALTLLTDVPGVLTADPCLVPEAYPVAKLAYREALELSALGLGMLHPRTVVPLARAGIPLHVRDSLHPERPGTVVDREGAADEARPTCLVSLQNLALFDLEGSSLASDAQLVSRALRCLANHKIDVWLSTPAPRERGLTLVVKRDAVASARECLEAELSEEFARGSLEPLRVIEPVSIVTLVGEAMGRTVNVAGRFFGALGGAGINVLAASQSATSRAISCVVDSSDAASALRAVHATTHLAAERVSVLVLGKGTVGGHLLGQIVRAAPSLPERHDVELRLVGLVDSRASVFDEAGLSPDLAREKLASTPSRDGLVTLLDRLKRLPSPVLVDCTASDGMEDVYEAAFARGVHVVTANKKPLASPSIVRKRTFAAARFSHRSFRYETTVGASLPVVETLQNLVRTGDRISRIEGSLSGTLGYLSNEVSRGQRLSSAVREARSRGYTEPHPREDLAGTDVARKALILARELGFDLEIDAVVVEPFVPHELFVHDSVETFLSALEAYDDAFAARVDALQAKGLVLRYLATIDVSGAAESPVVNVGPVAVPGEHPAAGLRGTEALVSFTTERYAEYPLVVRGAGAGGAVTAAGVLADIIAISRARRAR